MSFIQSGSNSIAKIGTYNDITNGKVTHSEVKNMYWWIHIHVSVYNQSSSNKLKGRLFPQ